MVGDAVRVFEVTDGDTFKADWAFEGEPIRVHYDPDEVLTVRILGYDAPERGQPGYAEAKAELGRLISGRSVAIVHEDERDTYGRLLVGRVVGPAVGHVVGPAGGAESLDFINVADLMRDFVSRLKTV